MFDSCLISIAKELNGGLFDRDNPIIHAVYKMHRDIIQFAIDLWKDDDPSDEGFKHHFEHDFPPGFINRDITRAKQVIYDLLDIAEGETVRHELAPIYTYVMYQLIYYSCAFMKDEGELKDQFPKEVKEYLKEKKIAPRSEIHQCVKRWFVDESEMYDDFQDTYNEDYTDSYFAEMVASMYLEDEWAEGKLACLGVEIDEFLDLLPNDLYIRVKRKMDKEKSNGLGQKSNYNSGEKRMKQPTVFISYSWEDEDHKEWVRGLADRLIEDEINVNIDQYDLSLGDRLPQFMEQQISQADYVLIICTPAYKKKADKRTGGVGYEGHIISGELFAKNNEKKFIPVIRKGTVEESMPLFLSGKMAANLTGSGDYEAEYVKLLNTLVGKKKKKNGITAHSELHNGAHIVKIKNELTDALVDRTWVKTDDDRKLLAKEPWRKIKCNNIMLKDESIENPDYNNGLIKAEPCDFYNNGILVSNPFGPEKVKIKRNGSNEYIVRPIYVTDMIPYTRISAVDKYGGGDYPYPTLYCKFTNGSPYAGKMYIDKEYGVQYGEDEISEVLDE